MRFLFIMCFCALLFRCAPDDGDGFLTDHDVCYQTSSSYYYPTTAVTTDSNINLNDSASQKSLAQKFSVDQKYQLWGVELTISQIGVPLGGYTVKITEGDSTNPSESVLAESFTNTADISAFTETTKTIQFSEIPHLEPSTTYWLVLEATYVANGISYFRWHYDSAGSEAFKYSNGTSWYPITGNAAYRLIPCR